MRNSCINGSNKRAIFIDSVQETMKIIPQAGRNEVIMA